MREEGRSLLWVIFFVILLCIDHSRHLESNDHVENAVKEGREDTIRILVDFYCGLLHREGYSVDGCTVDR